MTLPTGKVPWEVVASRLETPLPPDVLLGPGRGEDAALVKMGEEIWAVASDPITFTSSDAGRLAVIVNANDIVEGQVFLLAASPGGSSRVADGDVVERCQAEQVAPLEHGRPDLEDAPPRGRHALAGRDLITRPERGDRHVCGVAGADRLREIDTR